MVENKYGIGCVLGKDRMLTKALLTNYVTHDHGRAVIFQAINPIEDQIKTYKNKITPIDAKIEQLEKLIAIEQRIEDYWVVRLISKKGDIKTLKENKHRLEGEKLALLASIIAGEQEVKQLKEISLAIDASAVDTAGLTKVHSLPYSVVMRVIEAVNDKQPLLNSAAQNTYFHQMYADVVGLVNLYLVKPITPECSAVKRIITELNIDHATNYVRGAISDLIKKD